MRIKKDRKGFTIIELMVTIILIGMVVTLAGSLTNFSFMAEKKTVDEFSLQSEVRVVSEVLNKSIRNATVTFAIPKTVFQNKVAKWNYFGMEKVDGKDEIVQYIWNGTDNWDRKVLVAGSDNIKYNLYFVQNVQDSKLIEFNLESYLVGNESKKIAVQSELAALNSVAVVDLGSPETPAVAVAYRKDPAPQPEEIVTHNTVKIAIAMVLDESLSMGSDVDGGNHSPSRLTSLKLAATDLIRDFAALGNIEVCIIPFSDDANDAGPIMDASANLGVLEDAIDGLQLDYATNTGDGMRRAYYALKTYNEDHPSEVIVNYVILLTDGDPTIYSMTNTSGSFLVNLDGDLGYQADPVKIGWASSYSSNDSLGRCIGYAETIGSSLFVNGTLDINTYVLGFSSQSDEILRAERIADASNGDYITVASDVALAETFSEIRDTIVRETWHIYGPY